MAIWPGIAAPTKMTERKQKAQIKSDMSAGYVQSRAKWTRSRKVFELSWSEMSNADKEILETFFSDNIGDTFEWTHPLSGIPYTVRFVEDELSARYVYVLRWQVDLTLEEQ